MAEGDDSIDVWESLRDIFELAGKRAGVGGSLGCEPENGDVIACTNTAVTGAKESFEMSGIGMRCDLFAGLKCCRIEVVDCRVILKIRRFGRVKVELADLERVEDGLVANVVAGGDWAEGGPKGESPGV